MQTVEDFRQLMQQAGLFSIISQTVIVFSCIKILVTDNTFSARVKCFKDLLQFKPYSCSKMLLQPLLTMITQIFI